MALTVEDGSIVAGADSYISLADARTLATKYGWVLPADDTEAEQALRNGTGYVDLQEPRFVGSRVSASQELAWPRKDGTYSYGFEIPDDSIPSAVQCAQVAAAVEYGQGTDVRASSDGRSIASEEVVGAVKQSYFDNGASSGNVEITRALDCLKPVINSAAGGVYSLSVVRC